MQNSQDFWKLKIATFLHDFCINLRGTEGSENLWKALMEKVLPEGFDENEIKIAEKAERRTAELDMFLQGLLSSCSTSFKHPVSGEEAQSPLSLRGFEECLKKVLECFKEISHIRERYLLLWRFLPYLLRYCIKGACNSESVLLFPATTVGSDHDLWDHMDLSSAIAGAMKRGNGKIALVYIKIPGPQRLIQGSKKYKELWGASHLMARIAMEVVKYLAEKFGPDSIVYPSLRGNPFFDFHFFIKKKEEEDKEKERIEYLKKLFENLAIGCGIKLDIKEFVKKSAEGAKLSLIPNKIIAIVPVDKDFQNVVEDLKKKVDKALEGFLGKVKKLEGVNRIDSKDSDSKDIALEVLKKRFEPRVLWITPSIELEELNKAKEFRKSLKEFLEKVLEKEVNEEPLKEIKVPKLEFEFLKDPLKVLMECLDSARNSSREGELIKGILEEISKRSDSEIEELYFDIVFSYVLVEALRRISSPSKRNSSKATYEHDPTPMIFYEIYRRILENADKRLGRYQVAYSEISSKEGAVTCEICGENPALYKVEEKVGAGEEKEETKKGIEVCPICLLKRKYRELMEEEFRSALESWKGILNESEIEELGRIKYTSHVTVSLETYARALDWVKDQGEEVKEEFKKYKELVTKYLKAYGEMVEEITKDSSVKPPDKFENLADLVSWCDQMTPKGLNVDALVGIFNGERGHVVRTLIDLLGKPPSSKDLKDQEEALDEKIKYLFRRERINTAKELDQKVRDALGKLFREIRKIHLERAVPSPESVKYFSLMHFDGDNIGKLLCRKVKREDGRLTLEERRKYIPKEAVLKGECSEEFEEKILNVIKALPAIPTPLYHREVSTSLNNFILIAVEELRRKWEEERIGCLILYSGGDDFFLISDAVTFPEVVKVLDENFGKSYGTISEKWMPKGMREFKVMLPSWSGSEGVTISYFRKPFYYVISLTREAEEEAKEFRSEKRTLGLTVLLNSGISEKVRIPNSKENVGILRIMDLFREIKKENKEKISFSRFVHSALELLQEFEGLEEVEAFWELLKRESKRHLEGKNANLKAYKKLTEAYKEVYGKTEDKKEKWRTTKEFIYSMKTLLRIMKWRGENI